MGLDRYLRETTYHVRRRQHLKQQKKGNKPMFSVVSIGKTGSVNTMRDTEHIKKLLGVGLIVIALLLIFTQCFFRGDTNETDTTTQLTNSKSIATHSSIDYYTAMQDMPLDPYTFPKLIKFSTRYQISFSEALATWQIGSYHNLPMHKIYGLIRNPSNRLLYSSDTIYQNLTERYGQFIYDIQSFPISSDYLYTYTDSWKNDRNYKGERKHYGTDIMGNGVASGEIPIVSMTEGIVENIGWNELGGYRIGIRSNGGAYFYYAHLDKMPEQFQKGDIVKVGDTLGFMGDTGYGPEGTRGKFPVHLHIGIALTNTQNKEYWINPFPILQYLEQIKK